MAKNVTFDFDGSDEEFDFYSGPPPVAGLYHGYVKDMSLGVISAETVNKGKKRINMTLVIDDGKYKGAPIYHNLNVTKDGAKFVNGFLDALTDGSPEHVKAARAAFWKGKLIINEKPDQRGNHEVLRLGSKVIAKGDLKCWFMTKIAPDNNGVDRARIARFVVEQNSETPREEESLPEPDDVVLEEDDVIIETEDDDPWGES